jgi:hypothetical protein
VNAQPLDADRLADLLVRLLLDSDLRDRLATAGAAEAAADAGELECLETIDLKELDAAVRRFRSTVWRSGHGGNLAAAFPRSLRTLTARGMSHTKLLTAFLGSGDFRRFRLIPYAGPGVSIEEAFASFLLGLAEPAQMAGTGILRETIDHELLVCLFSALADERSPSFVIGVRGILETGLGHAAIRRYSPAALASWEASWEASWGGTTSPGTGTVPYAYFATPARMAHGVVSERAAAAFETHPTAEGAAAREALARRGLW